MVSTFIQVQLFIGESLDDSYFNTDDQINSFSFTNVVLNSETVLIWNPAEIRFILDGITTGFNWTNTEIKELKYSPLGTQTIDTGGDHSGVVINDSIEWPRGVSLQEAYPEYQGKTLRITGYMS